MKYLKLLLLFFSFVICSASCKKDVNITIFIHGSIGISGLFFKYAKEENVIVNIKDIPCSYDTTTISNCLDCVDDKNFSKEYFYVFGWSGKFTNKLRMDAARALYKEIVRLKQEFESCGCSINITLITHSHGGNVALCLARCVENGKPLFKVKNLILLAIPVQKYTCDLVKDPIFENVYNIYSCLDLIQVLDPQGLHCENKGKNVPFFSERNFTCCQNLKQARIKIGYSGVMHSGFLKPKFYKRLPCLLDMMNKHPGDSVDFIILQ